MMAKGPQTNHADEDWGVQCSDGPGSGSGSQQVNCPGPNNTQPQNIIDVSVTTKLGNHGEMNVRIGGKLVDDVNLYLILISPQ